MIDRIVIISLKMRKVVYKNAAPDSDFLALSGGWPGTGI